VIEHSQAIGSVHIESNGELLADFGLSPIEPSKSNHWAVMERSRIVEQAQV